MSDHGNKSHGEFPSSDPGDYNAIEAIKQHDNGRTILEDTGSDWVKVPYQVKFGGTFSNSTESLLYKSAMSMDSKAQEQNSDYTQAWAEYAANPAKLDEFLGLSEGTLQKGKYFKDTRVGANDAINCIWQFNYDDDISYPLTICEPTGDADIGMGRVYAQTTETNQTIAWFTFGVPRFTSLAQWYLNAYNKKLVQLNNSGTAYEGFLDMIVNTVTLIVSIPFRAISALGRLVGRSKDLDVNRFYSLRTTMHLYYQYVNSILSHWLKNTGVYGKSWDNIFSSGDQLPLAIQKTGPNIYRINARRAEMAGHTALTLAEYKNAVDEINSMHPDDYDDCTNNSHGFFSWISDWSETFAKTALGATMFVGFRINKNTDANESFSNSTRTNSIAEKYNSMVSEFYNKRMDYGNLGENVASMAGEALNTVTGLLTGKTDTAGFENSGIGSAITGGAFLEVPDNWNSSSYSTSHSLSLQLRSPYGDVSSIFQSIMVPLACLLAGVMPRSAGNSSYQQPFFCRYYVKGISAVTCGIIESMSIKRGASEFGWTYNNLPTAIDVNITIKDMSPILSMAMAASTLEKLFETDNAFQEYLMTLAGVGLYERISRMSRTKRNFRQSMLNLRNTIFNSSYWASMLADSAVVQFLTNFIPIDFKPRN